MVVCPNETGAVDSQDAVPDGEPAVSSRGAVLDQGADVDPRGAERSVLLEGKLLSDWPGQRRHTRLAVPKEPRQGDFPWWCPA